MEAQAAGDITRRTTPTPRSHCSNSAATCSPEESIPLVSAASPDPEALRGSASRPGYRRGTATSASTSRLPPRWPEPMNAWPGCNDRRLFRIKRSSAAPRNNFARSFLAAGSSYTGRQNVDDFGDGENDVSDEGEEEPRQSTLASGRKRSRNFEMVAEDGTHSGPRHRANRTEPNLGVAAPMPSRRINCSSGAIDQRTSRSRRLGRCSRGARPLASLLRHGLSRRRAPRVRLHRLFWRLIRGFNSKWLMRPVRLLLLRSATPRRRACGSSSSPSSR